MNKVIILTCTVNVDLNKSYLFQKDKSERIQNYLKTTLRWLNETNFNIVLVDNSGYTFEELENEKILFKDRFEVITFVEKNLKEANYLLNNNSKGDSELFAINYAFENSKISKKSNFIIKITGRFYIPEFEDFLRNYELDSYDCLTQFNRDRCEMVGSHVKNFNYIFNIKTNYIDYIEYDWKTRTSGYKNILICKKFDIEETQRGGVNQKYYDI